MIHKIVGSLWKRLPRWARRTATRMYQNKFTASAGVVIVNSVREVLLLDHQIRPGTGWGIPGGFIDFGEPPEDAAIREVFEETRMTLESVDLVKFTTRGGHLEFLFRARSDQTPVIDGKEILGFKWFKPDELPEEMSPGNRQTIIDAVAERIGD